MGDAEFNLTEKQDPMSHRIIEKRRRDRMNNCLADLSRLIPPDYLKKGRGRIEKTEIIEMAIRHLKYLQDKLNCIQQQEVVSSSVSTKHFRLGYQECLAEVIHYMVEGKNTISSESKSVQLITHLHRHCDQIMKGELSNKHRPTPESSSSSSGSSGHYTLSNQTSDSHSSQRVNEKTLAIVKKKLHNKHSDRYNSDKQYNSIQGMEVMQRLNKQMLDSQSSESNTDDLRTMYSQNNMGQLPLINDDNFAGDNNEERRENSLAQNKDVLPNDYQTTEDHRLSNTYSPLLIDYRGPESNLRSIRKADSSQTCDSGLSNTTDPDNIHSYKFKNNIQQRFSESLITDYRSSSPSEAMTGSSCSSGNKKEQFEFNSKVAHKRRKPNSEHHTRYTSTSYHQYRDQQLSSSETNSSENITSVSQNSAYRHDQLQESKIQSATSSKEASQSAADNRRCQFPEKFEKFNSLGVPIFALHASRSFYVPMSIDYETLIPFLGPYDLTDMSSLQPNTTFYPVTINVNFQPLGNRHLQMIRKREDISDWQ